MKDRPNQRDAERFLKAIPKNKRKKRMLRIIFANGTLDVDMKVAEFEDKIKAPGKWMEVFKDFSDMPGQHTRMNVNKDQIVLWYRYTSTEP